MFEAVIIGDLHLDKDRLATILGSPEKALELQMKALDQPLAYAKKKGIKNVVFLGDISDKPVLSDLSAKTFIEKLLDEPDLNFSIILGNHDIEQKNVHSLTTLQIFCDRNLVPNIKIYSEPTQVLFGKAKSKAKVDFIRYPFGNPISKDSLCFGHIERPGAIRDNGTRMTMEEGIPEKGTNKWIMGHLHTPHEIGNTVYCGTPYQTSFGEDPNKRFLHIKWNGKELKLKSIPINNVFTLQTIRANKLEDLVLNKDHYYRIYYTGFDLPINYLQQYPRIVECKSFKTKEDLVQAIEYEDSPYSLTDGIDEFLTARGFSKKEIKRALKLIDKASHSDSN